MTSSNVTLLCNLFFIAEAYLFSCALVSPLTSILLDNVHYRKRSPGIYR